MYGNKQPIHPLLEQNPNSKKSQTQLMQLKAQSSLMKLSWTFPMGNSNISISFITSENQCEITIFSIKVEHFANGHYQWRPCAISSVQVTPHKLP